MTLHIWLLLCFGCWVKVLVKPLINFITNFIDIIDIAPYFTHLILNFESDLAVLVFLIKPIIWIGHKSLISLLRVRLRVHLKLILRSLNLALFFIQNLLPIPLNVLRGRHSRLSVSSANWGVLSEVLIQIMDIVTIH